MAYTSINFKTKKALREALQQGEKITCYEPGLGSVPVNGTVSIEGPHYPAPHSWYAQGVMKDNYLISIK